MSPTAIISSFQYSLCHFIVVAPILSFLTVLAVSYFTSFSLGCRLKVYRCSYLVVVFHIYCRLILRCRFHFVAASLVDLCSFINFFVVFSSFYISIVCIAVSALLPIFSSFLSILDCRFLDLLLFLTLLRCIFLSSFSCVVVSHSAVY